MLDEGLSTGLSKAQRTELRARLEAARADLHSLLADETGMTDTVELDQAVVGRLSRIDAIQQQKMAEATKVRAERRLKGVEAAIERFEEDPEDFGCCGDCGEGIPFPRLLARPEASLCVPCLEARGR
jgi:DnaK suppressor protein